MKPETLRIFKAVVESDTTVSEMQRMSILRACKELEITPSKGRSERLISVREIADNLSISIRSVWRLVEDGKLHPIKIGKRSTRFRSSEIEMLAQ